MSSFRIFTYLKLEQQCRADCSQKWPLPLVSGTSNLQSYLNLPLWTQGKGLGEFHDIDKLTMFADYRVPVVLRDLGVLKYSKELDAMVQSYPRPKLMHHNVACRFGRLI